MNRLMKYLRIILLVAGAVALVLLARPVPASLAAGGAIVVLGTLVRIWSGGHLQRNQEVTTSGPYAYVRDPFYLGRLLVMTGLCIMAWGYGLLLLLLGLTVFYFDYMPRKYRKEMKRLEELFGERYREYAKAVPSLRPRLTPWSGASQKPWSSQAFWRENREQYFIALVLLLAVLILMRM